MRAHQFHFQPVAIPAEIISQERRGLVDIRDQDVEIAIIIEISKRSATAGVRLGNARAGSVEEFLEAPTSQVSKEYPRSLVRKFRMFPLHLGEDASCYPEQVRQAIIIKIHDSITPTHIARLHTESATHGDVVECKVASVAVQGDGLFSEMRLQ